MATAPNIKTALLCICWLVFFGQMVLATDKPDYQVSFDPAKGFKPAQNDLTEIFLQLAGSLEYYGSPEPYLRHMKAEHDRIEAKYRQQFGTVPKSFCPPYMDDSYLEKFSANWKLLSPKLGLEPLTKDIGNLMRDAINGTRGNGTMLVEIFNQHQANVYAAMAGKEKGEADFNALKGELTRRLELDKTTIHDEGYKIPQRDAVGFTTGIRGDINRLFDALDKGLKPPDAERIKAFVRSVCTDLGQMAHSELEAGIAERSLDRQAAAKKISAR